MPTLSFLPLIAEVDLKHSMAALSALIKYLEVCLPVSPSPDDVAVTSLSAFVR